MGAYEYAVRDCNSNQVADHVDIALGTSDDCNANAVPDECELTAGTATDCDVNGTLDECDLTVGDALDCNENGLPDSCDITSSTSQDSNQNGTPDECEEIPVPYRVEYGYDYMGRKIRRQFFEWDAVGEEWDGPVEDTKYVNDGWRVIEELDGLDPVNPDATTRQYTWGLDLAAQAGSVNSLEQAGGIGGLLATYDTAGTTTTADDRTFLYFYDANGNVGQVVETTTGLRYGTVQAHYEYTPYGQVLIELDLYDQPYRFSTKPFDLWTDLGYWGYRWYSSKLGRWVTRDPIDEPGGLNLYMYVFNTPTRLDAKGAEVYDDPEQTACCEVTDTIIYGSTRKKTKTVRCYRQGTPEGCCRCAGFGTGLLELGVRTFDRAHWGECCRCRLQVRRKDEPWIIGNWPQHVKLFVKCSNGAKWQFEFPTPPGYSDLFARLDEGYWTTDFEDIVTDMCVSCETAEKIRKKAEQFPMDTPYSGGWTDCYWAIRHVLDVEDAVTAENCPEIQTGRSPSPGARR